VTKGSGAQGGGEVVHLALQGRLPPEDHPREVNKRRVHVNRAAIARHDR
jgi:hypothetical protein